MTIKLRWQTAEFAALDGSSLYAACQLRQAVFVVEQQCIYQDLDGLDQAAVHILGWQGDALFAYQRCLPPGSCYQESSLGRVVVAPAARGLQLGRELLQRGLDFNRQQWPESAIRIGAQAHLREFYQSMGFVASGEPYLEDGILHVAMLCSKQP